MKNNVAISIIVPVYNAEKYLDRCLNSIYSQTFSDYEIILVNDGSKDNSLFKCYEFAAKDERITVIDKENGGAGSARNAGVKAAKGEYLAFPDVDDWFEPEMYADLYALAKTADYDIVFSGANNYSQDLNYLSTERCLSVSFSTRKDCMDNIMTFFPTSLLFDVPWNKLYKRSTVVNNGIKFPDYKRCQDAAFNLEVYNCANSVIATEKAYYNYINNDAEKVNIKFPKNYIDINVAYFGRLKQVLSDYGIYEGKVKTHYDTSFVIAVYETMNMFDNPRWALSKREKKEYVSNILERKDIAEFLEGASIREDVRWQYDIIVSKNVKKVFRIHAKERFKDKLRSCKAVMWLYRLIKRRNATEQK